MSVEPTKDESVVTPKKSLEIEKPATVNNEVAATDKKVLPNGDVTVDIEAVSSIISMKQFSISVIKSVTGAGILCTPYAMNNMGLIGTVISYYVFCLVNVWCASLLVKVNEYTRKNPSKYPPKEIGSDFASITYNILGPKGYYVFVVIYLVTIWGVQVGTLISIVDFICKLPITVGFLGDPSTKRFFFHIISSVICLLFVLLKDISPIIAVASLSIFALLISFVILLVYGFIHYGLTFKTSMLAPVSFGALFASMGVPSFSLGFNFSYMSFFKQLRAEDKVKAGKVTLRTMVLTTTAMVILPIVALLSYSGKEGGIQQNILLMIPEKEICAIIVNVIMYICCLFTYPIYSVPINEVVEQAIKKKSSAWVFVSDPKRLFYRVLQTVVISFIAFLFPAFADVISLVGGCLFTILSLIIPPLLHLICFKKTITKAEKAKDIACCVVFFIFMVISTIYSAITLIEGLKK
ncbi:10 transmembrane domain, possible aa transporter [Blastocystis sp. ATCC 50177/Nand II]|uniref:10 transmembrane domain, possible aa transporter n=1 Tax=Blastocystis sp. subtype 1 (strain ATCC 50177 / NandII) TaxID=478820 RepID=A0A196SF18_BLAHN|nr:10 transmembrane domain, possible aa transporter [Blastocystis sp. ATCC 50177/Nand II]